MSSTPTSQYMRNDKKTKHNLHTCEQAWIELSKGDAFRDSPVRHATWHISHGDATKSECNA